MVLLREAVRRGKEVTVVVELKARFDEEANINWAEMLESIGAQVVYGVVGLKTHAKMLLVTRREGRQLVRYAHLSTGNYNPRTARLYTDVSYLTADPLLTLDIDNLFVHLASQSRLPKMNHLLVAPFYLQRRLIENITNYNQSLRDYYNALNELETALGVTIPPTGLIPVSSILPSEDLAPSQANREKLLKSIETVNMQKKTESVH